MKTSSEVADPKWKGKILLTDPRVADNYMGWLDGMERRVRMDFPKLAAQVELGQCGDDNAKAKRRDQASIHSRARGGCDAARQHDRFVE